MDSWKSCPFLHITSHHIHLHSLLVSSSQNQQHLPHETTFFITSSSPSLQSTGQNLLTNTINTAHSKSFSTLLNLPTSETFTKLFLSYTTSLLTLPSPRTVHVFIPYLGCTSKQRKLRETRCPRTNYVPLISLGSESVKTSPSHTISPTPQLSALTRSSSGSTTTSTPPPGYTNAMTSTTYLLRLQPSTLQFVFQSCVSNSPPTTAEFQYSTTS